MTRLEILCRRLMDYEEIYISILEVQYILRRRMGIKTMNARKNLLVKAVQAGVLEWNENKSGFYINKGKIKFSKK